MFVANKYQSPEVVDLKKETFASFPVAIEVFPESEVDILSANLTHETPWADRQIAARKLGQSRDPKAQLILMAAIATDPFWMVRCVMIQALENIGDAMVVPVLQELAANDEFTAVRSAAKITIERLS